MNRSGRGIRGRYDESSSSRPSGTARPVWEDAFDRRNDAEKPARTSDKGGKKGDKGKREEKPKKEGKATILKRFDTDLDHYFKGNAEKETPSAMASKQEAKTRVAINAGDKEMDKAPVEKCKEGAEQEKSFDL
ncbi:hypothetical protein DL768_003382 [Monosporascus sp. mg162]|nr:hypothetical protein DL768_003382 [Monosporascus sp. mg162]